MITIPFSTPLSNVLPKTNLSLPSNTLKIGNFLHPKYSPNFYTKITTKTKKLNLDSISLRPLLKDNKGEKIRKKYPSFTSTFLKQHSLPTTPINLSLPKKELYMLKMIFPSTNGMISSKIIKITLIFLQEFNLLAVESNLTDQ